MKSSTWFLYIIECTDGSLYTGSTTDVARRLREHQNGTGAKYTRARPPVSLAYTEEVPDRSTAQRREAAIKKLPRKSYHDCQRFAPISVNSLCISSAQIGIHHIKNQKWYTRKWIFKYE